VKAAEAVVVTEAEIGGDCVIATAVTVSVKLHAPVSAAVSESVPVTTYMPAAKVPPVVIKPVEETTTWLEVGGL
jgi:hypothetical protein